MENKEKELNSLLDEAKGVAKSHKWIKRGTVRFITHILQSVDCNDCEDTVTSKLAAAYMLNSYRSILHPLWRIRYELLWRRLWRNVPDSELKEICEEGKKKVQVQEYYEIIISQTGLRDTVQTMTREEVAAFLREHQSERKG